MLYVCTVYNYTVYSELTFLQTLHPVQYFVCWEPVRANHTRCVCMHSRVLPPHLPPECRHSPALECAGHATYSGTLAGRGGGRRQKYSGLALPTDDLKTICKWWATEKVEHLHGTPLLTKEQFLFQKVSNVFFYEMSFFHEIISLFT